ncbi:hypothetical protein OG2516_17615 [Oceanicola granulosus HTCC2516]|uniref:Ferric siderophore reductase C-terminal domain-containing protein n=1 Tax=Oceanicola granulosus (strain ATCC BAA-861 / DSM 15982 / KCTC 12143 / HTCC2516) TaxID=314256 RepID=Q2CF57_OCEGH|nr:hypothetical protein OG2516_17615 [Oceanicola granulosus HTCC2516]
MDAWLLAEAGAEAGADHKVGAAYLLGRVAFALCEVLAALALRGMGPGDLSPDGVALVARRATWSLDGESGEGRAYDVVLSEPRLVSRDDATAALGPAIPVLLTPLVEALTARSGLSRGALWRIVGDSFAGALLLQGKHDEREDEAMALALATLRDRGSPLFARQTGFCRVDLPERPDIGDWFRARGGCCRYYTTEGGDYCSTCVLRDPDSRDEMLRAYLRRRHGLPAA